MEYNKKKRRWEAHSPLDFIGWRLVSTAQETDERDIYRVVVRRNFSDVKREVYSKSINIPVASLEMDT